MKTPNAAQLSGDMGASRCPLSSPLSFFLPLFLPVFFLSLHLGELFLEIALLQQKAHKHTQTHAKPGGTRLSK